MMPRNPENDRVQTTIRLPAALIDRIAREADERIIGRSKLIELLLVRALDALDDPRNGVPK